MDYDDAYLASSCYVNFQPSGFTGALQVHAASQYALAAGLCSMGKNTWGKVLEQGESIPDSQIDLPAIPRWNNGFRVDPEVQLGTAGVTLVVAPIIAEAIPEWFYPEFPDEDHQLVEMLQSVLIEISTAVATMTQPDWQRIRSSKPASKKTKPKGISYLWAKSQGNTILNSMSDYRYRPSFGGLRATDLKRFIK